MIGFTYSVFVCYTVREADKKKPYLQAFFATAKEQCQHYLADIKTTSIHK
ncbi:hypothetical protein Q8W13_00895 [Photobacterium damselae subsp. piscicida]|nr:hypothetical protein [Photobacterium damselae]MDP2514609.1 hypothetical protein [Photobacterium damselae subsp. piscicida]MDP2543056.1 hypothetical protein [Photobacterium damselae subsp. piscicida]